MFVHFSHFWDGGGAATDSSKSVRENIPNPSSIGAHLKAQMSRLLLLLLVLLFLVLGGLEVVASHRVSSSVPLPATPSTLNEAE